LFLGEDFFVKQNSDVSSRVRSENSRNTALAGSSWNDRGPALKSLFEDISAKYDRLNHLLSFGLDARWRKDAALSLNFQPGVDELYILDLASGTGDLAAVLRRRGYSKILRADLSAMLLRRGAQKMRGRGEQTEWPALACEMDRLPLRDSSMAGIAQGFALRHCRDYAGFFRELRRVLAPGGRIALLDMRYPAHGFGAGLYRFYFRSVLPRLAALLGGERGAYEMMVESVRRLPPEDLLCGHLRDAGFVEVASRPGIFGAVRLLTARRPG
jgi:demethylmenaquinone methyltransferase / 2-methoxy-6-polyprenyl-1,4-benzoquinol methylase